MTRAGDEMTGRGVVRRRAGCLAAPVRGQLLLMSVELGRYFGLNALGARIWTLLEAPTSIDALVARLVEEYEVSPEQCRREVGDFVAALAERGLVESNGDGAE